LKIAGEAIFIVLFSIGEQQLKCQKKSGQEKEEEGMIEIVEAKQER
jgi:hypothetical protein